MNMPGTHRLQSIFEQLACQQMRFMTTVLEDASLASRSQEEHRKILDAIIAGDSQAAAESIRTHYRHIKKYYVDKLLVRLQF